ncbi:MAG: lysostaphin resistance A-like protein [Bacilli bacterium]
MEPIYKKLSNANFYFIAFLLSLILFNILPIIFMVAASLAVEFKQPGFFTNFMNDYLGTGELVFTPTIVGILSVSQMLGEIFLAGLFVALLWKVLGKDWKRAFSKNNIGRSFATILIGLVAIYASTYAVTIIYELLKIEGTPDNQNLIESMLQYDSKIFMIITTVLLAPFVEEIIFRKLLFGVVEEKFKLSRIWAILISAALFAAVHGVDVFFFQYLALALVISGVYAFSNNNVFVSIALHFLNNSISIVLFFFAEALL